MSELIRFKPLKNTERTAIQLHGEWWVKIRADVINGGIKILIQSQNGVDKRWIHESQATERVTCQDGK